ncbi:MAG: metallophosphoesterase [Ruminococcus flavefaciens]|nr:metallophosphoesterase [Ruminococcus flavefaciens]
MVYITGDIHGSMYPIYELCNALSPTFEDVVVILGDVAANYDLNSRDRQFKRQMSRFQPTFFCIHGNHECRPQNIASYKEKQWNGGTVMYEEEFPNILFPVDGEIFMLAEMKCLVIGGAYSVDKYFRLQRGLNWWADEQPSEEIKIRIEDQIYNNHIDVVFSHTCPYKHTPIECFLPGIDQSTVDNSTEHWLDTIEESIDYKAWYCGHWHINKRIDRMHFLYHNVENMVTL